MGGNDKLACLRAQAHDFDALAFRLEGLRHSEFTRRFVSDCREWSRLLGARIAYLEHVERWNRLHDRHRP